MPLKDYTAAPYFAITTLGYGKGFTPEEAIENYVKTQLRNISHEHTIFNTKKEWETALRSGDAKPQVWKCPEGWTGFLLAFDGLSWKRETDGKTEYRKARIEELVVR